MIIYRGPSGPLFLPLMKIASYTYYHLVSSMEKTMEHTVLVAAARSKFPAVLSYPVSIDSLASQAGLSVFYNRQLEGKEKPNVKLGVSSNTLWINDSIDRPAAYDEVRFAIARAVGVRMAFTEEFQTRSYQCGLKITEEPMEDLFDWIGYRFARDILIHQSFVKEILKDKERVREFGHAITVAGATVAPISVVITQLKRLKNNKLIPL